MEATKQAMNILYFVCQCGHETGFLTSTGKFFIEFEPKADTKIGESFANIDFQCPKCLAKFGLFGRKMS